MTTDKRIKSLEISGRRICSLLCRRIGGIGAAGALVLFAASALAAPEGFYNSSKGVESSLSACGNKGDDKGGDSKKQGGDGNRPNLRPVEVVSFNGGDGGNPK